MSNVYQASEKLFANVVDCPNYQLIKKISWYVDEVSNDLNKMTKNSGAVERPNLLWQGSVSIIAVLKHFKAACDVYNIHEGAAVWLFKRYLSGPVETVLKTRVALPTETDKSKEGCLTSFLVIMNYLLKLPGKDENIASVHANVRSFKQSSLTDSDYAQLL